MPRATQLIEITGDSAPAHADAIAVHVKADATGGTTGGSSAAMCWGCSD
ncbi:hypothetical protein [Nocardia sp. NPDC005825]